MSEGGETKSNGDGIGSPSDADGASNDINIGVSSGENNSATAGGSNKDENGSKENDTVEKQDGSPSAKVDGGTTSQKDGGIVADGISSNSKVSSSNDHAYDLPTDDEGGENTNETSETNSSKKISMSPSNKDKEKDKEDDTSEIDLLNASSSDKDDDDDDDDSDIELLDAEAIRAEQQKQQQQAAASKPAAAAKSNNDDDSDEELEIMGTTNEQKFPHNRKECLDYRYNANSTSTTTGDNPNAKFCSLCYCYVCDKKASECENWYLGEKGICTEITADNDSSNKDDGKVKSNTTENATAPHNNHCNAQDKGDQKYLWQNMRNAVKNGRDPSKVTNSYMPEPAALPDPLQQYMANYSTSHTSAGHRNHATSRGARQRHSHGGGAAAAMASSSTGGGTYGSTTYAAARSRSAPPPPRRRRREGSSGTKRPAQADHRARIRTQQMLEDLYG